MYRSTKPGQPFGFAKTTEVVREPMMGLSIERSRISAEIQSMHSGFQAQFEQLLHDCQATAEITFNGRWLERLMKRGSLLVMKRSPRRMLLSENGLRLQLKRLETSP